MKLITATIVNSWELIKGYSCWMMFSFLLSGILHNFLKPEFFQKNLGDTKIASLFKAALSGLLLPICNCGVVPLGISLYYSGAYLGNVMAFMIATPVINPAALLICLAILGPKLTLIYAIGGTIASVIAGYATNLVCRNELMSPFAQNNKIELSSIGHQSFAEKFLGGLKWGFAFLGKEIIQFALPASIFGAFFLTVVPTSVIQKFLSRPDLVSILGACALGCIMDICAIGHIPFVGALIGAGASPGTAITYLLSGTGTDIPALVNINKFLGRKAAVIYGVSLTIASVILGYTANILLKNFVPIFDVSLNQDKLLMADKIFISFPEWFEVVCGTGMIGMFVWGFIPKVTNFINRGKA